MTTTTQNDPPLKIGDRVHIEAPSLGVSDDATVIALAGETDREGMTIGPDRIGVDLDSDVSFGPEDSNSIGRHGWHFELQHVTPLAPAGPRYVVVQRKAPRGPAVHDTYLARFAGFHVGGNADSAAARMNAGKMSPDILVWRTRAEAYSWFDPEPPVTQTAFRDAVNNSGGSAARVAAFLDSYTAGQYDADTIHDNEHHKLLVSDLRALLAAVQR